MIVDFQYHYVPKELAQRRGLYSEKTVFAKEGGTPSLTMHAKLYFDMAGFEGGLTALRCALLGIKPQQMVFATDYPQDFTGVSTDTGRGMGALRDYSAAVRALELEKRVKQGILGRTAAHLLKIE